jgi:hypothetical protein
MPQDETFKPAAFEESAAVQETAEQFGSSTTGGSINEVGWRFSVV